AAVAVGLPDKPVYRRLLARSATALHRLGIGIYLVCEDGRVQTYEEIVTRVTELEEHEQLAATKVRVQGHKGTGTYQSPTNPAYLFYRAFRRMYKNTGLTQKEVSAACRAA